MGDRRQTPAVGLHVLNNPEPKRRPKRMTKSTQESIKTWATVAGVVVLLSGVAWAAGNYPTRGEWNDSRAAQGAKLDRLKDDVGNMKIEQVKLRGAMDNIEKSQGRAEETQRDINNKLDRALTGARRNR